MLFLFYSTSLGYPVSRSWPSRQVRCWLPLLAWVSCWISHWLATSSVLPLPQDILQSGQIGGGPFCGWVGVPFKALTADRRWTVQDSYPPLLGISARLTFMDDLSHSSSLAHPRDDTTLPQACPLLIFVYSPSPLSQALPTLIPN